MHSISTNDTPSSAFPFCREIFQTQLFLIVRNVFFLTLLAWDNIDGKSHCRLKSERFPIICRLYSVQKRDIVGQA